MSKNAKIYDDSSSNLFIEFQTALDSSQKIDLKTRLFRPADSSDLIWKLENYMQNNDYVNMTIDYLKKEGFDLDIVPKVINKLRNVISSENLKEIQKLGMDIKNSKDSENFIIPNFKRTLKTYQIMPVNHLISLRNAANFSVPGSGKTTIVLAAFSLLKQEGIVNKLLVIGPYSSLMPWEDEIEECFINCPEIIRIHGSVARRMAIFYNPEKYEIFLTTYQTAVNDIENLMKLISKDNFMLVLDESHNIKNISGKRANTLINLNLYPKAKTVLTGTPMPNDYTDLYIQFTFLYPSTLLGNANSFKAKAKYKSRIEQFLKDQIHPLFTRITKSQLDLPPVDTHLIPIEMSRTQTTIYRAVAEHYDKMIEEMGIINFGLINKYKRNKAIRLRQITSNLELLMESIKEYELESLKEELENDGDSNIVDPIIDLLNKIHDLPINENSPKILAVVDLVKKLKADGMKKIIIWSDFIRNLILMKNILIKEFKYEEAQIDLIYGETPKAADEDIRNDTIEDESREGIIRNFKKDPNKFSILIMNPMACAESISLHRVCHHAIYLDRSYNCGQFMQSKDRIHRIGLPPTIETHYYFLLSFYNDGDDNETIDHKIHRKLLEKENKMLEILNDPSRLYIDYSEFDEKPEELIDIQFDESEFDESEFDEKKLDSEK